MKIYIKAAVSVENLKTQFAKEIPDDLFKELIEIDPTSNFDAGKGGKYCPWIFRQYNSGKLQKEDITNLKDALEVFSRQYKKFPNPDLGSYKTVQEFLDAAEQVGNRELTDKEKAKMLKKQAHHASDADKKFLVADGEWEVWQPLTHAGSISLAREGGHKARWCTAYEGDTHYWNSYTKQGPLYIFLNKSNPDEKYQLHIPSNSWYNIDDRSQGMDNFYKFCDEHPAIGDYFKVYTKDGVTYCANTIVRYAEGTKRVVIPEGIESMPDIKLPRTVVEIHLPASMTEIKSSAFEGTNIREIDLSYVRKIGAKAFRNCKQLKTAIFNPDGVIFGAFSFADDEELDQSVTIKDDDTLSIGVFDNCPKLTVVWDAEDASYDFYNIKALEMNVGECPTLYECNNDPEAKLEIVDIG